MIKNGKPINGWTANRYRGKERCPIESGMKREWQKKKGQRKGDDRFQATRQPVRLIDGRFPTIIREIIVLFLSLRSWTIINFFERNFKKIRYNNYIELSRTYIRYLFSWISTDGIAESSLMGFLAKLESITCKRTASLFAIIDSPNVSYKRVQGRGGGRIF